jgi:hypothetical protein
MERGPVVKHALRTLWLGALVSVVPLGAAAAERSLVLITSTASRTASLDVIEVRKLFLGLPVMRGGAPVHPVCNVSDPQIQEAFLQYVVSMSQSAYDRRILSLVNNQGRPPAEELASVTALLARLESDPQAVSYAWSTDVAGKPRIRILRVLWQG